MGRLMPHKPFDLHGLQTYPLMTRPSKVFREALDRPADPAARVADWLDTLPRQLAGNELRRLRDALVQAHADDRTVVAALGGHVIKTGCGPYLVDLIGRGVVKAVVMNG